MFNDFLYRKIDNAQLIAFRVFYGILVCCEAFGAIATGWVRKTFIEPQFTFSFIGFEWLQPLPGDGMYYYFVLMGLCGILITVGYKYRYAAFGFAVLWSGVYLMQKTSYNNHYYLLMLLAYIMGFLPANRNHSLDAKFNPSIKTDYMYNYVRWIIIVHLFIVYTYASVAKLYADWFDSSFIEVLMKGKKDYFLIGEFLQEAWVHKAIGVFGIAFDLLVVPALLWKPTRRIAFALSIFFHLFNSYVFRIGIFPYLSLAFCVFFFETKTIRKLFFKKPLEEATANSPIFNLKASKILVAVFIGYFFIQILLPLRHHIIPGNVVWTEEGHRLSWRMMLRSRSGYSNFRVVNKETKQVTHIDLDDYLTKKQRRRIGSYPDFIWTFAQRLKKEYKAKGEDVQIFVTGKAKVNQGEYYPLIDPKVDMAEAKWNHFRRNEWILIPEEYK
ncbi:HTTM domain-containing protein [Croceivirga thetidis]|uniref:HTTM domain-containing protein n=1 Tax=Croceivirga thetidis TaxID=2721623 RepID=A0ABX1GP46_9FLAO|nr:HTTM domain-containing protein [Croceivirga thetidis]NKI30816.1 HTTM domain-containing protein [Croceivirga thetidis]